MLFLFIFFTCSQLFLPTICPPVRKFNCGLAGQKKPETSRRNEMIKYKDFRRRNYIDPFLLDPKELQMLAPTTTPRYIYYNLTAERCDYMRIRCMKAYLTGEICARTIYYEYWSFTSYCAMVFHNCIAKYDNVWSIAYMGYCTDVDMDRNLYVEMTYDQMSNNSRMQSMYVADSADITSFEGYPNVATTTTKKPATSILTTTPDTIKFTVTDKQGKRVTDVGGSYVTATEIVTVPNYNVTDANGIKITDYDGDYVTITETQAPKKG